MTAPSIQLRAHPLALSFEQLNALHDEWKFNCGPAAICAVTGLTPEQLRPHMRDFERKGYTNPSLMFAVLRGLGIRFGVCQRKDHNTVPAVRAQDWPSFGLVRIQWGGPWMRAGVPERARYRHTHWIATDAGLGTSKGRGVFDVNAVCGGGNGWIALADWETHVVPWLIKEAVPKGDGTWSIAHAVEIEKGLEQRLQDAAALLSKLAGGAP